MAGGRFLGFLTMARVAYRVLSCVGMDSQWKRLGRPALVGFVVGLFVMTGLAYVAPVGLGVRTPAIVR
jgi:hypothetical protein